MYVCVFHYGNMLSIIIITVLPQHCEVVHIEESDIVILKSCNQIIHVEESDITTFITSYDINFLWHL